MMNKDISANLKCSILGSPILLEGAPQYDPHIFVTVAIYWVPDLPDIKGFSGHLWRSILIFANGV